MRCRILIFLQPVLLVVAQELEIIRDYFVHKSVKSVVGFSCNDIEKDYRTMRMLSNAGISTSIRSLHSGIDLTRFLVTDYWNLGVFVDLRCQEEDAVKIFAETSARDMYDHLYNWLILGRSMNETLRLLNDSSFSIITDVAISIPGDDVYHIYDVYNHCKLRGGLLNLTKLGTWRRDRGLHVTLTEQKISRRWDYHGMTIRIGGIVLQRPKEKKLVEYLKDDNTQIMDNWPKFGYIVLEHIAEMFNWTLDVTELTHWAQNDSNGPLMNGLKDGKFDLGYYPSILTIERYNYARVILQTWPMRTCFMFRTIPYSKMNMNIIIKPFSIDVWYMIAVIIIITIILLAIILKLEKIDKDSEYATSFLITTAALCQQGLPSFTDQSASRIAFLHVTIFGLLVYNYYSAAIVSARLNTSLDKMNDSLYSLVHSGMKLSAEKNVFFNFLLRVNMFRCFKRQSGDAPYTLPVITQNPRDDVQYFRNYWKTLPEKTKFLPVEDGIRRIIQGPFAYHADPTDAYPLINRLFSKEMICQLTEVHLHKMSMLGLWSTPRAQFLEPAKIGMIRISTAGLRRRQVERWSSKKPYCNRDEIFASNVTIYETAPVLILLACGMMLSVVVCIFENITFRASMKKGIVAVQAERKSLSKLHRKKALNITQEMLNAMMDKGMKRI